MQNVPFGHFSGKTGFWHRFWDFWTNSRKTGCFRGLLCLSGRAFFSPQPHWNWLETSFFTLFREIQIWATFKAFWLVKVIFAHFFEIWSDFRQITPFLAEFRAKVTKFSQISIEKPSKVRFFEVFGVIFGGKGEFWASGEENRGIPQNGTLRGRKSRFWVIWGIFGCLNPVFRIKWPKVTFCTDFPRLHVHPNGFRSCRRVGVPFCGTTLRVPGASDFVAGSIILQSSKGFWLDDWQVHRSRDEVD